MATLLSHTAQAGGNTASTTTSAINTTGATLIKVACAYYNGAVLSPSDLVISDNKGNTYTTVGSDVSEGGGMSLRVAYVALPTVGSGHTVTATNTLGTGMFAPVSVEAWDGTGASPLDQTSANGSNIPGSITPSQNGCIVITDCGGDGGTPSAVDSGFTIDDTVTASGSTFGLSQASQVQSTAAAINLTWTGVSSNGCSRVTSFLTTAPPASVTTGRSYFL